LPHDHQHHRDTQDEERHALQLHHLHRHHSYHHKPRAVPGLNIPLPLTITTKDNQTALDGDDGLDDIELQQQRKQEVEEMPPDSGHSSGIPHHGKKITSISVLHTDNTTLTGDANGGRWWTKWPIVLAVVLCLTVIIIILVVTLAVVSTVALQDHGGGSPARVPTSPSPTLAPATNHSQLAVLLNHTTTTSPTQSPPTKNRHKL
jgi:hypothetical protein